MIVIRQTEDALYASVGNRVYAAIGFKEETDSLEEATERVTASAQKRIAFELGKLNKTEKQIAEIDNRISLLSNIVNDSAADKNDNKYISAKAALNLLEYAQTLS